MKPKVLKLIQARIRLTLKLIKLQPIPYGGTNPYHYCASCGVSTIQETSTGHEKDCQYQKLKNGLKALEGQIERELELFLTSRAYEKKAYKNFVWFKGDISVEGLWELEEKIEEFKRVNSAS